MNTALIIIGLFACAFFIATALKIRDDHVSEYASRKKRIYFASVYGLPRREHLLQKERYCWWWNSHKYSWELCDARRADHDIYTHWAPWYAFPNPSDTTTAGDLR